MGTSNYTYDTQGQLLTYTPPLLANYSVAYGYSNVSKTSVTAKENNVNKYQTVYDYFKNDWLKQVKGQKWNGSAWVDQVQVDYEYDATGRCTKRKNGNGADVQTDYAYNARGETSSIKHWNPARTSELYSIAYIRDAGGNPIRASFTGANCPTVINNQTVAYGYDEISRLTSESIPSNSWTYDWVGNRSQTFTASYNPVDEMKDGSNYVYDMRGNLEYDPDTSSVNRTQYHYNANNLLSQVDDVDNGVTTSTNITWDGDQQRLMLQRGTNTWQFVYDPTSSNPSVLFALEPSGNTAYFRDPYGCLLASNCGTTNQIYHFDNLASTVLLTNGGGSVSDAIAYGAWGDILNTQVVNQPYQFVGALGYYQHTNTQGVDIGSFMQLGVRSYYPNVGRFTQLDPIRYGLNYYSYVSDQPTYMVDPKGLFGAQYGNYCGMQTTPGKGTGIDQLDECCHAHDDAFAAHGCTALNQFTHPGCKACTHNLCTCAKAASCAGRGLSCCLARKLVIAYACGIAP